MSDHDLIRCTFFLACFLFGRSLGQLLFELVLLVNKEATNDR